MADDLRPDLVLDAGASLGEGPTWDLAREELLWVDIEASVVHRLHVDSGRQTSLVLEQPVGAALPRAGGGLVLAMRDGFALLGEDEASPVLAAPVEAGDADTRMNDAACDSRGRLWAGTLSYGGRPSAALYRWTGSAPPVRVLTDVTISNGLGWSPDDRQMYYVDTATGGIDVFDFHAETGWVGHRRRFATIPPAGGRPDGLAVDADGGIWVALWGGAAVQRFTPRGRLDRRIALPVSQVTSCCFAGPGLHDLYITSAARGVREPHAGGLFACRPGNQGLPTTPFAG